MKINDQTIINIDKSYNWIELNSLLGNNLKYCNIKYDILVYLLFTSWWVLADWGLFLDDDKPNSMIEYEELKENFLGNMEFVKKELITNYKFELALGVAMSAVPIPFMTNEGDEAQYNNIIKIGAKYCFMAHENNPQSSMCKYFSQEKLSSVGQSEENEIINEINSVFLPGTLLNEYLVSYV